MVCVASDGLLTVHQRLIKYTFTIYLLWLYRAYHIELKLHYYHKIGSLEGIVTFAD